MVQRLVKLDGASNFRDAGGFETRDGRRMKSGILFRSDELSQLSDEDLTRLDRLGLRLILDFRTLSERKPRPDKIPRGNAARIVNIPIGRDYNRLQFLRLMTMEARKLDFERLIKDLYCEIAFDCAAQVKEAITLLAYVRNLPALLHCTTGKDRTGCLAALIQSLVGVPRETILEDYLVTNQLIGSRLRKMIKYLRWMSLFQVSPEHMKPMFEARREYLEEPLDEIMSRYGTIETYLCEACGIQRELLTALERSLIEQAPESRQAD